MFTRITVHRTTIHALLERVADAGLSERSCRQCAWLLKREHLLWTFLDHKDVEPTNNRAERRVRRGVLMRKKTFGTDSVHGSRFVERILTATGCLDGCLHGPLGWTAHAVSAATTQLNAYNLGTETIMASA